VEQLHLVPDEEAIAKEVDVLDPQAEDLALPQPAPGGQDRGRPPLPRRRGDNSGDLLRRPRHDIVLLDRGRTNRSRCAGVVRNQITLVDVGRPGPPGCLTLTAIDTTGDDTAAVVRRREGPPGPTLRCGQLAVP
jgi:hypothetical protein